MRDKLDNSIPSNKKNIFNRGIKKEGFQNRQTRRFFVFFVLILFPGFQHPLGRQGCIELAGGPLIVQKDSIKTIEAIQLAESMAHDVRTAMKHYR